MSKLNIGFGRGDITPNGKMQLIGQFTTRVASSAHDPLMATVMALGTKDTPVFWVSCDLLEIMDEVTHKIADAIAELVPNFTRDRLIVSCIHNHTGPYIVNYNNGWGDSYKVVVGEGETSPDDYVRYELCPTIARAAKEAYDDMKPSATASVLGHAVVGHCRRVKYRDGSEIMYGSSDTYNFDRLEASPDNGVEWVFVYDETGTDLRGLVMNVVCPAQVCENMSIYTADYVGCFRERLWESLGREVPLIASIGCAGNISPRDLVRRGRGEPNMHNFDGAYEIADRLLCCYESVAKKAPKCVNLNPEFAHWFSYSPIALRTVSESEAAAAHAVYDPILAKYDGDALKFTQSERSGLYRQAGIIEREAMQKKCTQYDCPIHAMKIGDTAVVTNPFELYIEYGLRMIARSKFEHTIAAQLTDDCAGYLPTPEAVEGGSYSTFVASCIVSSDGAEQMTETTIRAMNRL